MATLNPFTPTRRLIVKIGSALLIDKESGIRTDWLQCLCDDIAALKADNIEVVIVSSGAIAIGRQMLRLSSRNLSLSEKQACAATGQSKLTQAYAEALGVHNIITAQALFTLNDTENRQRGLNARSTLKTLLALGAVPIINENDTVATDEIRYGDNDRLAARTAQMLEADTLVLLSDIDGLYTDDPRQNPDAEHIPLIAELDANILAMGGGINQSVQLGSGGMATKLLAAQIAIAAGCHMWVMDGTSLNPLKRLMQGAKASWFQAKDNPLNARRHWIKASLQPLGTIEIDAGAAKALGHGKSLLAAGITAVSGAFNKGDAVKIVFSGREIARGLSAYSAADVKKIQRLKSDEITTALGYYNGDAVIHRDNMVDM